VIDSTLESAAGDLDGARDRINATRDTRERPLDSHDRDLDEVRATIARPERDRGRGGEARAGVRGAVIAGRIA
jgi:hypothetical protein